MPLEQDIILTPSDSPQLIQVNVRRRSLERIAVLVAAIGSAAILVKSFALAFSNRPDAWWSVLALGVIEAVTGFLPIS